jgi:prepilin-type N-terminal cleavage/methylation domain-containing protein
MLFFKLSVEPRPTRSQRGFTLIELIITTVLLGLLGAVGASMISDSFDTTRMVDASQVSAAQARYALERLEREIRETKFAGGAYAISTMTATRLVFTRNDGVAVTIDKTGNNLTLGYSSPVITPTPTLTNQVSALTFTYYSIDPGTGAVTSGATNSNVRLVEIALSLQDAVSGQTFSQRVRVGLRNAG